MILGYFFLGMLLLSFFYFILDGIVAPSEQILLKASLYKTKDEIEELAESKVVDQNVIERLRRITITLANNMSRFNVVTLTILRIRLEKDAQFRAQAEKRVNDLTQCDVEEAHDIHAHVLKLGDQVLVWNSIGWAVLLVPIVFVCVLFERIQGGVKFLLTTPEKSFERMQPTLC